MIDDTQYPNFFCLDNNPLVHHKLTVLRNQDTAPKDFREIVEEITYIVAIEALKNLTYTTKTVQTPLAKYKGIKLDDVILIPIIRAGVIMINPLQKLLPNSKVGFMGLSRNHSTLDIQEYYKNLPKLSHKDTVIILDPMLATGNTLVYTIKSLVAAKISKIIIVSILAAKPALDNIFTLNPNVLIYSAGFDKELNAQGYIVPGLGDAGNRIFNTFEND